MKSLDYDRLMALFHELGEELRSVGASGKVYVVGGSAMALAGYTENRVTHDVDAHITDGHGHVVDAVRKVGRRHDLPGSWLNEQVTPYLSTEVDLEATLVFEHPNLVVTAASPSRLLAMKLVAGRAQDIDDASALIRRTKLGGEALRTLIIDAFGRDALTERVELTIQTVFDAQS